MANSSIDFRRRVLRYYDLVVQFNGSAPKQVRAPSDSDGETFARWRKRVLGDDVSDVRVFRPVEVNSTTRMRTLAREGADLKDLLREATFLEKRHAKEKIAAAEQEFQEATNAIASRARREVKSALAKKEVELQQEKSRAYERAAQVPVEELEEMLHRPDLDAATQEFIQRVIEEARSSSFPLGVVLSKLIDQRVIAVAASKEKKDV